MSILVIRQHFHRVKIKPPAPNTADQPLNDSNPFRAVMRHEQPPIKESGEAADDDPVK
jgi:hypothetical protein